MKYMKYGMVWSDSPENLAKRVNEYLNQGWKPQGGIAVTMTSFGRESFYQAIYIEKELDQITK